MSSEIQKETRIDRVQLVYASVLDIVSHTGMVLVAAGFIAYVFRLFTPTVSIEEVAAHWHMRASEMQKVVHVPKGWSWVSDPLHGDVLSFVSIVFLSMAAMICLTSALAVFFQEKNRIYTIITFLQITVLAAAVAGIAGGAG
ncbi:MAG: DUF1634 domain-containing protein [Chlorobiaceae bacterium]|nr:DUF1634 domain-containing protein [Chlorobiaceae bacterium]